MPKHYNCIACKRRCSPKERRSINSSMRSYLMKFKLIEKVTNSDFTCTKCRHSYYKAVCSSACVRLQVAEESDDPEYEPPVVSSRPATLSSPPSVSLPIPAAPASHSRCIICKRPGPKLVVVSHNARFRAFIDKNILIRSGCRCCPVHVNSEGSVQSELLDRIATTETSVLSRSSISNLIQDMRATCKKQLYECLTFDNIKDDDCVHLTGLTRNQFDNVCGHVLDKVKSTPARSPRMSVGLFLVKLKSALSNRMLATFFRISSSSVRRAIHSVRKALMRSFVPLYLGLEATTREEVIKNHTRPLAKSLFDVEDDSVVLVLDGTYVYIQKSDNFAFQRSSYSLHKCRPLVKPMVIVTTTGYFVTIMGPYLARNNDASILNHMMKRNLDDIQSFLKEEDLFIVDRGFRDSLNMLEEMGIRAAMPAFLKKGEKQMSVEDANMSRFVTKIRWVVESANSRIKRYKYLDRVLPTRQVPYIGDYVRIVCALSNKYMYFPALTASSSVVEDEALANRMIQLSNEVNTLKVYVENNNLERRKSQWTPLLESELNDFPILSDEQLRSLTCGIYQLKLSSSYMQEYVAGDSVIQVHKQDDFLLCFKIQSRHVSAKTYMLWIRYDLNGITAWYCKCRAGARVVGVCSHIAAVVWYLSSARHDASRKSFGVRDWGQYLADAKDLPETIDASDTDSVSSSVTEE